jgi:hypothetical protein
MLLCIIVLLSILWLIVIGYTITVEREDLFIVVMGLIGITAISLSLVIGLVGAVL